MIDKFNISLKPPLCHLEDEIINNEVEELLDNITKYFSQVNVIYDAKLTVSNNEWESVPNHPGAKQRNDVTFDLHELREVWVTSNEIKFKVGFFEKIYKVPITKDFFYFFEWETAYYE